MNDVRRVGDTVRRSAGPWTASVHRYLDFVHAHGVDWAPRPFGLDDDGREILSFIEGIVPAYPLPSWVWDDAVLIDGGRLLRQLHDASVGFRLDGAIWQLPSHHPIEVICHNDFAPHNLAFDEHGAIVGAIDFDMCSPGPRIWDIAYFATRTVPMGAPATTRRVPPAEARRRVELLLTAYGSDATWADVVRAAIDRLYDIEAFSVRKAEQLGKPELLDHAVGYREDAMYLATLVL